jgi:hypothetical protein
MTRQLLRARMRRLLGLHRLLLNPNNYNNLGNLLSLKRQPLRLEQIRFGHSFGTVEKQER